MRRRGFSGAAGLRRGAAVRGALGGRATTPTGCGSRNWATRAIFLRRSTRRRSSSRSRSLSSSSFLYFNLRSRAAPSPAPHRARHGRRRPADLRRRPPHRRPGDAGGDRRRRCWLAVSRRERTGSSWLNYFNARAVRRPRSALRPRRGVLRLQAAGCCRSLQQQALVMAIAAADRLRPVLRAVGQLRHRGAPAAIVLAAHPADAVGAAAPRYAGGAGLRAAGLGRVAGTSRHAADATARSSFGAGVYATSTRGCPSCGPRSRC